MSTKAEFLRLLDALFNSFPNRVLFFIVLLLCTLCYVILCYVM
jgi:hypothetical protein